MKALQTTCFMPGGKQILRSIFDNEGPGESIELLGLKFPNRVGLAAGFDKNAAYIDEMATLGFGHIEVGTLTPKPQSGNSRPRLFRLPQDDALINRMGFNNGGVQQAVRHLANRKNRKVIVGGNIGKNKNTPNEDAWKDYLLCFQALQQDVDYFTINLSSPNTPGLRNLLGKAFLVPLLEPIQNENQKLKNPKPIFLKISPDLETGQLEEVVDSVLKSGVRGIVATNTTIDRGGLQTHPDQINNIGAGGLSGKPLLNTAERKLDELIKMAGSEITIISSGGIMDEGVAARRIKMGAHLVQLYTGLIYAGPELVKNCRKAISGI